jgi:hypothetical protein
MVRAAFEMSWPRTLVGAWLVLRANQKWAPFPDNDPAAARRLMTLFYRLLRESEHARFDPARAAELEVEWWRVHREAQHGDGNGPSEPLVNALAELYAYCYSVEPSARCWCARTPRCWRPCTADPRRRRPARRLPAGSPSSPRRRGPGYCSLSLQARAALRKLSGIAPAGFEDLTAACTWSFSFLSSPSVSMPCVFVSSV